MATVTITVTCDNCGKQITEQRIGESCFYGVNLPKGWDNAYIGTASPDILGNVSEYRSYCEVCCEIVSYGGRMSDQYIKFDLLDVFWQPIPAQPLPPGMLGEPVELTITYNPQPDRKAKRRYRAMVNAAIRILRKGRR